MAGLLFNGEVGSTGSTTFTEADVRLLAGERTFQRGLGYLGSVTDLATWGNKITASVSGTSDYQVVLTRADAGGVRGECDCPQGKEGFFCKHCVAVALTVLRGAVPGSVRRTSQAGDRNGAQADGNAQTAQASRMAPTGEAKGEREDPAQLSLGREREDKPASLVAWLLTRTKDDLLDLVLDQLMDDDEWRRRLELRAATAAGDLEAIYARITDLLDATEFAPYGYVEEGDSSRFARRLRDAAEIIDELVEADLADDAVAIAEYAIDTVAASCRNARDPSGVIANAAQELAVSHRDACAAALPDPVALADFLAECTLSRDEIPYIDFASYLDLLGTEGIAELRSRFTSACQADPAGWSERRALERLLSLTGEVDDLVAELSAHLDGQGHNHLRIATELDRAGRADEALAWAERGLREASRPGEDLASYVVERYWLAGRDADALTVRRDRFAATRDLAGFQRLRVAAERAGDWPATRSWALDLLRADAASGPRGSHGPHEPGEPHGPHWKYGAHGPQRRLEPDSVLVDALIDEGDLAAAWDAAKHRASEDQWLRLADLVAQTRPADALAVYLRQIEPLRQETGERTYRRMARLLYSARDCHHRLGTDRVFNVYLRALRAEQKRKRRLIAILDAQGLREASAPQPTAQPLDL